MFEKQKSGFLKMIHKKTEKFYFLVTLCQILTQRKDKSKKEVLGSMFCSVFFPRMKI